MTITKTVIDWHAVQRVINGEKKYDISYLQKVWNGTFSSKKLRKRLDELLGNYTKQ